MGVCAIGLASIAWLGKDDIWAEFSLIKASTFLLTTDEGVAVRRWSVKPGNISTRSVFILMQTNSQQRAAHDTVLSTQLIRLIEDKLIVAL